MDELLRIAKRFSLLKHRKREYYTRDDSIGLELDQNDILEIWVLHDDGEYYYEDVFDAELYLEYHLELKLYSDEYFINLFCNQVKDTSHSVCSVRRDKNCIEILVVSQYGFSAYIYHDGWFEWSEFTNWSDIEAAVSK